MDLFVCRLYIVKMWTVLFFGLMSLSSGAYGSLADDLVGITQQCCNQGKAYARNHTSEECSSSYPPDVPAAFGSLCIFAMDQCCKDHFQKKRDCNSGIDMSSTGDCTHIKEAEQSCCKECLRGQLASQAGQTCPPIDGTSLEKDAYAQCCKKAEKDDGSLEIRATTSSASKNNRGEARPAESKPKTKQGPTITSLCEEYAPNELCAHHCIPVPGSYKCECNPGFMLMADGRNCREVTKNRCKVRNPCQHKCNDNGITVKCSCRRGYQLMEDGKSCEDIDECSISPPVCLPSTLCFNIQGSYKCIPIKKPTTSVSKDIGQCPPGFARNLQNNVCDDINECELPKPPCPSYLCENTIGRYKCGGILGDPANLPSSSQRTTEADDRCPPGFTMGSDEECEDVNECLLHKDDCNPLSQFCINTRGSFFCQNKVTKHCPPGFMIHPVSGKCEDINECEEGPDICRPDQICVNVPGEYDCKPKTDWRKQGSNKCPEGMRMKPGTRTCEDIDECVEGTHMCDMHQNCLNTNGSHECHCKRGFEIDHITGGCVDVNECATNSHNCIPGSQRCDNTVGSFLCVRYVSCGTGYILQASTGQCEDIDECALGTHNCGFAGKEYHCENQPGSFLCVRTRHSTSTTAAPLEYEYEYYDSDEDIEGNTTKSDRNQNNTITEVSTTTTPVPINESSPAVQNSKPTEVIPPSEIPEKPDTPYIDPRNSEKNNTVTLTPEPTTSTQNHPETEPSEDNMQVITIPVTNRSETESTSTDPSSTSPNTSSETSSSTTKETTSSERNPVVEPAPPNPEERSTEIAVPTDTTTNVDEFDLKPETTPASDREPSLVYVDVGKETATIKGEKTEDGSVFVDTKDLPKNEWTVVDTRPSNCQPGFEVDELGVCVDIDECAQNRHTCSGLTETCRNTMGGYICVCAIGFRRDLVSGACEINPTSSSTTTATTSPAPVPTVPESTNNYFWGYRDFRPVTSRPFRPRTLCDVGYHLNTKTRKCEDVNECQNGQANCASVEICVNTEGGYRCECQPNWRLDEVRHRCVPIRNSAQFPSGYGNEPVYLPPKTSDVKTTFQKPKVVEAEITPIEGSRSVITCPVGYKLGYDNNCEDIDECVTGQANCGDMLCTNLPGGYVCSCPQGHKLSENNQCEDVNECELGGDMPICSQNADCVNTKGSYRCKCHDGFRSAPVNDKVCVDVDECVESSQGSLCQHRCNNVWGGYRCSCHRGYRLNPDNRTCTDVNECEEFKSKILCVGRCVNDPGSYHCVCPRGYRLSEDKRSCIDIDECENGEATCAHGEKYGDTSDVCLNTRGGYRCHNIKCPPGYKLESRHRCTRVEKVCQLGDWECAHQPTTYSYNFITFVSKLYIPASKVDLFTMRGPAWVNAKMRFQLKLTSVNAPPNVEKADINSFVLVHTGNQAVMSLVKSLEGPQSIALELSMELYHGAQFGGTAVARLFIYVSEYEF